MPHLIALSGGVDSSVALYLSRQKYGGDMLGVTISLADENSPLHESDVRNIADAKSVCDLQNTEHRAVDLNREFSASHRKRSFPYRQRFLLLFPQESPLIRNR